MLEYGAGHCVQARRCRCGDRHGDLADDFLCAGAAVPLPVGEQLPAAVFRTWHERVLLEADLFGRRSGRNPEYGH